MKLVTTSPRLIASLFCALGTVFTACLNSDAVEEAVFVEDTSSAWVSDNSLQTEGPQASNPHAPPPEEVARELFKLQQQMGGSIVTQPTTSHGRQHVADAPTVPGAKDLQQPLYLPPPYSRPPTAGVRRQPSPWVLLRETAWQLDTSAHRLETLDLYSQADALREVADRLRKDARKLKKKSNENKRSEVTASSE